VPRSTQLNKEPIATSTPEGQAGVFVVRRQHLLVRCSRWVSVPILLGLILSGLSIYWASAVYQPEPDPLTGNVDPLADIGIWICAHVPSPHHYSSPPDWVIPGIMLPMCVGGQMLSIDISKLCFYEITDPDTSARLMSNRRNSVAVNSLAQDLFSLGLVRIA